ncbi:flavodoxin domain-containing protein [Streptomyces sp. GC420]|uniref:flavodoxin domain-containing protein n=1 Tax=Streptomyces sp. GC420 TaxID=2697568 RepID=UPI0014150B54|nr:flavodoxin domain-containing protein [Streptomyces sp. GC420]NBM18836.1 flavodoxin [Streptomyces sp. GC420]
MRVLIGYGSLHGATKGIAERLAAGLREFGFDADVRPLDPRTDPEGYDAYVLGSAVHDADWLPGATAFVRAHARTLAGRPVWFYSVGLARVVGGWFERHAAEPKSMPELRRLTGPRAHRLLAGALRREHIPLIGRVVYRLMGGRYGDFRDWAEIDAWAQDIAFDLAEASV